MAEKLAESTWTSYTKKQKLELEDKALVKALAGFDKAENGKPDARLAALDEVTEQIKKQVAALVKVKKQLGDKPFIAAKDKLYELLEQAEKLQQDARQESLAAKAPAAGKKPNADDEGDDEDSAPNALLDTKLLFKQLTVCRRDPQRRMRFAFVDAKDKAQPAVLVLHPRIGARALFSKLQSAAGVKTGAYGTAWVDGTSLMLQLDKPLSGLVKKVRAPVKAAGFKISKAILWNEDGMVFEQDEEPDESAADAGRTPAGTAGTGGAAARTAGGGTAAGDGEAPGAAGQTTAAAAPPPTAAKPTAAAPATGDDAAKVTLYKECRAIYAKARSQLQANLQKLEKTVGDMCTIEAGYDPGDAAERAATVYRVLEVLDERLLQTLDRAEAEPARRDHLEQEALDIIDTYLEYATGDPLVAAIDDNGFVAVGIRRNVVDALTEVARRL